MVRIIILIFGRTFFLRILDLILYSLFLCFDSLDLETPKKGHSKETFFGLNWIIRTNRADLVLFNNFPNALMPVLDIDTLMMVII